jgi:hypothetical protein
MRAGFDPEHQMRVIQLETAVELGACVEAAKTVESLPTFLITYIVRLVLLLHFRLMKM